MRLIAVGDIHGQYDMLVRLMEKIQPNARDQVVYLGDYINRGPDSKKVIEFLVEFQKQFPQTIFLRGNHEQMLLDATDEIIGLPDWTRLRDVSAAYRLEAYASDQRTAYLNGGLYLLKSYQVGSYGEIPFSHIEFMMKTKLFHRESHFIFVHAAFSEDRGIDGQDLRTLLWERAAKPGQKYVHVVGHSPISDGEPIFEAGRILLDTGAGYKNRLTACDVVTREIWQVEYKEAIKRPT